MKIYSVLCLAVLAAVCLFANGCQEEASSDQVRMARLVGNENLELKKQLKDKDGQIAVLNKQLEQSKQETAEAKEQNSKLQNKVTASESDYQRRLEQCEQAVNTASLPCPEVEEKYAVLISDLGSILSECQTKLEKYEQAEKKE